MRGTKAKKLRAVAMEAKGVTTLRTEVTEEYYDQEVVDYPVALVGMVNKDGTQAMGRKITLVSTLKEGSARKLYKQLKKAV